MTTTLTLHRVGANPALIVGGFIPRGIERVYGATFLEGSKVWAIPGFAPIAPRAIADLRKVTPHLQLGAGIEELLTTLTTPPTVPPDYVFKTNPFDHQREGVAWLLKHPRGGLFFDPGLGKCKITVDVQSITKDPFLILCPAVVLRTWAREFITHGGVADTLVLEGSAKKKEAIIAQATERAPAALISTYETAARYTSALSKVGYTAMAVDESHRIKSITSTRTKAALILSEKASRRILLSGTPTLGNPLSIYAQLRFLGHFFARESWIEYKKTYALYPEEERASGKMIRVIGYKGLPELNERVNAMCLRKTQNECLDLPDRRIIDILFTVSSEQRSLHNQLVLESGDEHGVDVGHAFADGQLHVGMGPYLDKEYVFAPEPVALLNKVEQVLGGFIRRSRNNIGVCNLCPKLEGCIDARVKPFTNRCDVVKEPIIVEELLSDNARADTCKELLEDLLEDPTHKVIIWTRYLAELGIVGRMLKELGAEFVTVQGGMHIDAFEGAMKRFNTDPACRVYLGQVASGIGVTLNAAQYMIYYSLPWSHEHYVQSIARNYRIGQSQKVTVYRLLAEGTIDTAKAEALDQKIEIEDMIVGSETARNAVPCLRHSAAVRLASLPCTCDDSILRIVAKLKPIA